MASRESGLSSNMAGKCRMTNDRWPKSDEARMTKQPPGPGFGFRHLDFFCHAGLGFRHSSGFGSEQFDQFAEWIVKIVHHPFLQWGDGVVGDGDVLRADFGAAFGQFAVPV